MLVELHHSPVCCQVKEIYSNQLKMFIEMFIEFIIAIINKAKECSVIKKNQLSETK